MRIKMNSQGRITLPGIIREYLELEEQDELQVELAYQEIVIRKAVDGCIICNAASGLVRIGEYFICERCIKRLAEAKPGDFLYSVKVD